MENNETYQELANYLGEPLNLYAPGHVSLQKVTKLLKEPTIQQIFRLYLLNPDETINRRIPDEDIIIDTGNYSESYQNGQRRNISISLNNSDGKYTPNINTLWITTRFRLDVGIRASYYIDEYWFPRGIYVLCNPVANHSTSDKQINLTLADKFAYLESPVGTLEGTYEIPEGTDIRKAIEGILALDNGTGYPIDVKPIVYDASFEGMKMPYTLSKDAGSSLGEILLDIATILNAECFYNSDGHLTYIPINETTNDVNKPTLWNFTDEESEYLSSSISYDFENAVNSVYVVGDNVNNAIVSAMRENMNPESPICIPYIGRRIMYINDANIYSDKLAMDRASYELRKKSILETTQTITVAFNPLLFVNNLISLTDDFFKFKRQKFLIQSISYGLGSNNQMTLTCSNLVNFKTEFNEEYKYVPCTSQTQAEGLIKDWFGGTLPDGLQLSFDSESPDIYLYAIKNSQTLETVMWATIKKATSVVFIEHN